MSFRAFESLYLVWGLNLKGQSLKSAPTQLSQNSSVTLLIIELLLHCRCESDSNNIFGGRQALVYWMGEGFHVTGSINIMIFDWINIGVSINWFMSQY